MWAHGIEPEQFGRRHSGFLQAVPAQRGKGGKRACTQDTEPRRTAGCRKGGEDRGGCARGGREGCNHCSHGGGEAGEHANTRSGDQGRSDCARRGSEAGCRSVRACRMAQAPRAAAGTQSPATWRRATGLHLERQARTPSVAALSPARCAGPARFRTSASRPGDRDRPAVYGHERPRWDGRSARKGRPDPGGRRPQSRLPRSA